MHVIVHTFPVFNTLPDVLDSQSYASSARYLQILVSSPLKAPFLHFYEGSIKVLFSLFSADAGLVTKQFKKEKCFFAFLSHIVSTALPCVNSSESLNPF